jgi:hypothetical protein
LCIFVRFFLLNDGADYIGINDSNIWKSTFWFGWSVCSFFLRDSSWSFEMS